MQSDHHIEALRAIVYDRLGLVFNDIQTTSFMKNMAAAAAAFGVESEPKALLEWLKGADGNTLYWDEIARHLTVGETYFFRELAAIDLLTNVIIPDFIQKGQHEKEFRIWSAGCSSGEEPYTLAIVLKEAALKYPQLKFEILATDLNPKALDKARMGCYSAWSFRETKEAYKKRYFSLKGNCFEISSDIKELVTFKKLNLIDFARANEMYTKPFDVIFSRNVLMYFDAKVIKEVSKAFHAHLKENGWFVTSQVELNDEYFSDFTKQMHAGNFFYRKKVKPEGSTSQEVKSKGAFSTVVSRETVYSHLVSGLQRARSIAANDGKGIEKTKKQIEVSKSMQPDTLQNNSPKNISENQKQNKQTALEELKQLADAGKLNEALDACNKILSSNPENYEVRYILALILLETSQLNDAERTLLNLLYLQPEHLAAQYILAGLFNKQGKIKQSKKQIENLINQLDTYDDHMIIDGLEGITAGRMRDLILKMHG